MTRSLRIAGKEIEIRPLSFEEKKRLEREGLDLSSLDQGVNGFEIADRILELCVVNGEVLGNLDIQEICDLYFEIIRFSFSAEILKNTNLLQSC